MEDPTFTIQTPRLLLRPITLDDAADMFRIRSDPETARYQRWKPEAELLQTRDWIQYRMESHTCFVVELASHLLNSNSNNSEQPIRSDQPKVIGYVGCSTQTGFPYLGYTFNKTYWGKGYASEALQGVVDAYWREFPNGNPGLKEEDRDVLRADTNMKNLASQSVLKKCGFELVDKVNFTDNEGKENVSYEYLLRRPSKP